MPEHGAPGHRGRPSPARRLTGPVTPRRRRLSASSPATPVAAEDTVEESAEEPETSEAEPAAATPAPDGRQRAARTRGRLGRALFRPGRGQVIAAVILFVVGLGGVMQLRSNAADDTYATARREDLVQILDGLGAESQRLDNEVAQLQQTRSELKSGADGQRVAREETRRRVSELSILAGTARAQGPGIVLRITDPGQRVGADVLLDAVEEMRDAGAEVIEINDSIRIVASSWFAVDNGRLVADGRPVSRPITIEVIGDAHSLEEAARFRGGLVSEVTGPRIGGQVQITQEDQITIDSLHTAQPNQYARPAPPAPTPR